MATFIGEISENTTAIPTLQLKMSQENEIKIALTEKSMATLRHRLALQGSRTTTQATLETNTLLEPGRAHALGHRKPCSQRISAFASGHGRSASPELERVY